MSIDVLYISDDVRRTFDELSGSGSLREIVPIQLSGTFWNGETLRIIGLANLRDHVLGLRYSRVVWDTPDSQVDIRLVSHVEAGRGR